MTKTKVKAKEPKMSDCPRCGKPTFHDLCVRCRTAIRFRYYNAEQDPTRTGTRTGVLDLAWDARQRAKRLPQTDQERIGKR